MQLSEITVRTKKVIRDWAKLGPSMKVLLDDKLNSLRSNAREEMRQAINEEFEGENNMHLSKPDWEDAELKTVRDVRDLVDSRINKKE